MNFLEIKKINQYNNIAMIKKFLLTTIILLMTYMPIMAFDYTTRTNLSLDESISDQNGTKYAYPEKILVTKIESLDRDITSSPQQWIDAIYYYTITRLGFADVPYNFFLDEGGNIYQGRKGYIGVIPEMTSENGTVVIGYLSSRSTLTTRASNSLKNIYQDLSSKYGIAKEDVYTAILKLNTGENSLSYVTPQITDDNFSTAVKVAVENAKEYTNENLQYKIKIENITHEDTVQVGEKLEIKLTATNLNDFVWFNTPDNIYVSTSNEEETVYAINGVWDSFSKPTHLSKEYMLPGESIDIEFSLQANALPGDKEISFNLLKYTEKPFTDSSFDINFKIEKGDKELGEISSPEGYLNVRKCPGYNCEIITSVENGQVFIIKDTQDAWKKIEYEDGKEGWVFIRYIKSL
jgi:hypothetical protein